MIGYDRRALLATLTRLVAAALLLTIPRSLVAAEPPPSGPARGDRCPVCGMFVAKYPKWVARIVFRDGTTFFYDGAKDMFKHLFDVGRYTPRRAADDVLQVSVTDYYEVELIDAHTAYYVTGSDVLGPMGHELLPFGDEAAAREFMKDHRGKSIVRMADVTPDILRALDRRE